MILLTVAAYSVLTFQTSKKPRQVSSRAEIASVRRFVQRFYDWYTPKVLHENVDAEHLALVKKGAEFAPELRHALLDDWQAQHDWNAKGNDGIVGIDWDPFLSGQDPANRYCVKKIERNGKRWRVSVWSHYGEQSHEPDVIAIVEKSKTQFGWEFVDFDYGKEGTLLEALKALKKNRDSNP